MATAQHVKSLIQSHFQNEQERFRTLAMQLAAHEAKRGHVIFAEEIRKIIDQSRLTIKAPKALNHDRFNHCQRNPSAIVHHFNGQNGYEVYG